MYGRGLETHVKCSEKKSQNSEKTSSDFNLRTKKK